MRAAMSTQKRVSGKYCPRFGQIAVAMGFITLQQLQQLKQALCCQIEDEFTQGKHRFLGVIRFEKGWMSSGQIEAVLNRRGSLGKMQAFPFVELCQRWGSNPHPLLTRSTFMQSQSHPLFAAVPSCLVSALFGFALFSHRGVVYRQEAALCARSL